MRCSTRSLKIFNERVEHLTNKVIEYGKQNHVSTLHVANLGDLIGGLIHVSTRVQANEDAVEQIKYVSETLAEVLAMLVISCYVVELNFLKLTCQHR